MRLSAGYMLRALLVAVAVFASSASGYLATVAAYEDFMHGHAGVHVHHVAAVAGSDADLQSGPADDDPSGTPYSDDLCTQMHVHCCSTVALPAGDCTLKVAAFIPAAVPIVDSLIPHGQIASPLFRPPRVIA